MEKSKTTFRPILFSTPMVQAILEGRKTMTRRTKGLEQVNENPNDWGFHNVSTDETRTFFHFRKAEGEKIKQIFGTSNFKVGDVLWVRETHRALVDCATGEFAYWSYKADMPDDFHKQYPHKWKPSIFMPKSACRIFLKVKSIQVERLQDISEQDAIAEGVEKIADYGTTGYRLYTEPEASYSDIDAMYSFESLWQSINGRTSWDANPFVFVYEFERIEKPLDFIQ